jgi:2-oxoglutarate dehydrogenase E2 component (dihydrolipoamide succinyltransferase)
MALIDLKVPSIGESVTEVTLAKILKKTGEIVRLDDPICEFESDKATFELPAEASGSIEWMASEGQDLKVGDVVAKINTDVASPSISTTKDEVKIENNDSSNKPHPAKNHPSKQYSRDWKGWQNKSVGCKK